MMNKNEKKELDSYSLDELKSLYKNINCYIITEDFIRLRKYDKKTRELDYISYFNIKNDKEIWNSVQVISYLLALKSMYTNLKNEFHSGEFEDENDKFAHEIHYLSLGMCYDIIQFFCNPIDLENENKKYKKHEDYNNTYLMLEDQTPYPATQQQRDDWFDRYESGEFNCFIDKLHADDDYNTENDIATLEDVYYFVWNTLKYCSLQDLNKLRQYAAKEWLIKPANRPRFERKIHKYDKLGNYICTFENRQECIRKENIKKSMLSLLLSGKRQHYKGFIYREENIT